LVTCHVYGSDFATYTALPALLPFAFTLRVCGYILHVWLRIPGCVYVARCYVRLFTPRLRLRLHARLHVYVHTVCSSRLRLHTRVTVGLPPFTFRLLPFTAVPLRFTFYCGWFTAHHTFAVVTGSRTVYLLVTALDLHTPTGCTFSLVLPFVTVIQLVRFPTVGCSTCGSAPFTFYTPFTVTHFAGLRCRLHVWLLHTFTADTHYAVTTVWLLRLVTVVTVTVVLTFTVGCCGYGYTLPHVPVYTFTFVTHGSATVWLPVTAHTHGLRFAVVHVLLVHTFTVARLRLRYVYAVTLVGCSDTRWVTVHRVYGWILLVAGWLRLHTHTHVYGSSRYVTPHWLHVVASCVLHTHFAGCVCTRLGSAVVAGCYTYTHVPRLLPCYFTTFGYVGYVTLVVTVTLRLHTVVDSLRYARCSPLPVPTHAVRIWFVVPVLRVYTPLPLPQLPAAVTGLFTVWLRLIYRFTTFYSYRYTTFGSPHVYVYVPYRLGWLPAHSLRYVYGWLFAVVTFYVLRLHVLRLHTRYAICRFGLRYALLFTHFVVVTPHVVTLR